VQGLWGISLYIAVFLSIVFTVQIKSSIVIHLWANFGLILSIILQWQHLEYGYLFIWIVEVPNALELNIEIISFILSFLWAEYKTESYRLI
jgi:hypothetical protein